MIAFTLRQLEYFVAAVEEGSITAAALRMNLSQSAMSTALANLERAVGAQLLVRNASRGLALTDPGRTLLSRARRMLEDADALADGALAQTVAATGTLTVSSYSTLAPYLIPRVLASLGATHPDLQVTLREAPTFEHLERSLFDGSCEVALAYDHGVPEHLTAEPLAEVVPHAILPAGHPLAGDGEPVSLAALADEPFVLFDASQASTYMLSLFRAAGVTPRIRHRTTSVLLLESLVARGVGYSILNQRPAQLVSVDGVEFAAVPFREQLPSLRIVLLYPNGTRLTRKAEAFAERCRSLAPEAFSAAS
jgi:DNA-binding transcriptional LysR family regulator